MSHRTVPIGSPHKSQKRQLSLRRIAAVTFVGAFGLWLTTFGSFEQEVRLSVVRGDPLPEFRVPVLDTGLFDGDTTFVRSEDLLGSVALLSFWATWCSPCLAEQPSLLALQDEFGERGLRLLGVLHNEVPTAALEWLQENDRLEFETVVGTPQFASASRGAGLPSTLLVDKSGQITEMFVGYRPESEAYLRRQVQRLLEQ
jgi:thiol-disulfide isomerase/thioredoxin